MKKIAALFLVEVIIILALLLAMNMFMFQRISVSISGVVFMFRMAARSGFRRISFKVIAFIFVTVVFFTVQLVFMYQAIRKAVLDFRNRNMHSSGTARWESNLSSCTRQSERQCSTSGTATCTHPALQGGRLQGS